MARHDPAAVLVLGGLALGGALALATPTHMLEAPEPAWRGKGAIPAQQQAIVDSGGGPVTYSGETYPVEPWPVRATRVEHRLAQAAVVVGDAVRLGEQVSDHFDREPEDVSPADEVLPQPEDDDQSEALPDEEPAD